MTLNLMRSPALLFVGSVTLLGCKGDSATDPGTSKLVAESMTVLAITGVAGSTALVKPAVRVIDSRTREPVANVPIQFVADNGSTVANDHLVTDANGIAAAGEWQLSVRSGLCRVAVWMDGRVQFSVVATVSPDVPNAIRNLGLIEAIGIAGQEVPGFGFVVVDRFANGVPNVTVSLTSSSGGTLRQTSAVSDSRGDVSTGPWRLSSTPGVNKLTATVPGLQPIEVSGLGIDPVTIRWYELQETIYGGKSSPPSGLGISSARFGLTTFDNCLCRAQDGYFVDETIWDPSQYISQSIGRYHLDGPTLSVPYTIAEGVVFDRDRLVMQRRDPDFGFIGTWVYTPVAQ